MNIGEKIKYLRKKRGLSAEELGKMIGKNRATIYRYEKGDIESMPYKVIEPIAKALNVLPSYFFDTHDDVNIKSIISNDSFQQALKKWINEVNCIEFNNEELQEIFDYAKYIVSKRK